MPSLESILQAVLVPTSGLILAVLPFGTATAADIPAKAVGAEVRYEQDFALVRAALEAPEGHARLAEAGLTSDAVLAHVATLTPAELHYLAEEMQRETLAGGDGAGVLVAVLVILVLVLAAIYLFQEIDHGDAGTHPSSNVLASPTAGGSGSGFLL